ncbi:MAG: aminodeoxychorismate/anthranilate synthase component II [Lachnospiraceae bacterium]|nr:aminodeoxychorismate/anthranilate synthase component II [Lachnospiraceae bacterium]
MLLLIDNYDSFSYNLVQMFGGIDPDIRVIRNDACTVDEIRGLAPSHIVLSPGPGYPVKAGVCEAVVRSLAGKIPILGVCLGHQAICEAYGAVIAPARQLMHGKQSLVDVDTGCPVFRGLPDQIPAARYHSLVARADTLPDCLQVTATAENGEIMAVCHKRDPVYGLQFHPESILTPQGHIILENFLEIKKTDREG